MSDAFERAFVHTVGIEGNYSNNPKDRGGPTRWGITERVARAFGYAGDMRDLPIETAKEIYCEQYWRLIRLDDVAALSQPIALEMFDTAVNCSQQYAVLCLQRALNVFNREQTLYADIVADGLIGRLTLAALKAYLGKRGLEGENVMLKALNCLQGAYYISITESRPANEEFVYGWIRTRVALPT